MLMRVDGERVQPDSQEIRLAVDCLKAVRLFAETERTGKYRVGERDVQVEWAQLSSPSPLAALIFANLKSPPLTPKKSTRTTRKR